MKLGFTGTQQGMTLKQFSRVEALVDDLIGDLYVTEMKLENEFHIGDCIGSDAEFHKLVFDRGRLIGHIPNVASKRAFLLYDEVRLPLPYLDRNKNIVRGGEDGLIAAPAQMEEILRSGTWSTIRFAHKLARKIYIVFPDGSLERR